MEGGWTLDVGRTADGPRTNGGRQMDIVRTADRGRTAGGQWTHAGGRTDGGQRANGRTADGAGMAQLQESIRASVQLALQGACGRVCLRESVNEGSEGCTVRRYGHPQEWRDCVDMVDDDKRDGVTAPARYEPDFRWQRRSPRNQAV